MSGISRRVLLLLKTAPNKTFLLPFCNSQLKKPQLVSVCNSITSHRQIHRSKDLCCENSKEEKLEEEEKDENAEENIRLEGGGRIKAKTIDVETSIRYMKSKSYQISYRDAPVWVPYRKNFPGQFMKKYNRRTCIIKDELRTGNPCPICRDEYLVVHYSNLDLLKQFINPYTGDLIDIKKVQVCQRQYKKLLVALQQAMDKGLVKMSVPFREYDYSDYYPQLRSNKETTST